MNDADKDLSKSLSGLYKHILEGCMKNERKDKYYYQARDEGFNDEEALKIANEKIKAEK